MLPNGWAKYMYELLTYVRFMNLRYFCIKMLQINFENNQFKPQKTKYTFNKKLQLLKNKKDKTKAPLIVDVIQK